MLFPVYLLHFGSVLRVPGDRSFRAAQQTGPLRRDLMGLNRSAPVV
jgi:hypothetical protein